MRTRSTIENTAGLPEGGTAALALAQSPMRAPGGYSSLSGDFLSRAQRRAGVVEVRRWVSEHWPLAIVCLGILFSFTWAAALVWLVFYAIAALI